MAYVTFLILILILQLIINKIYISFNLYETNRIKHFASLLESCKHFLFYVSAILT